jgi:hypothetical protein
LALHAGVDAWEADVARRGASGTTKWLLHRAAGADLDPEIVIEAVENLILAEDPQDRALARAEIAEMVQAYDPELADVLWFAVRDYAISVNDADLIADATGHIADVAFDLDEPTTAAEAWIDFLNWRREPESTSDPETVLTAFDEIIRAAELDGAKADAARFAYLQVQFQATVDRESPAATVGNWLSHDNPLESWS